MKAKNRPRCANAEGGADVFVCGDGCDNDFDFMETIARAYINAQTWVPTRLVEIQETNPPAPDWEKELVERYKAAIRFGVSGVFVVAPDFDIPGGPMLRLHPF